MAERLLEVRNLKKYFPLRGGLFRRRVGDIKAVDGVDFNIGIGESFGLVGESGSGKTTIGKTILRLIEPTEGEIIFEDHDLCKLSAEEMRRRRADMQMIFQNPYSSLNPRMKVKDIVAEPMVIHKRFKGRALEDRVRELVRLVGLMDDHLYRYPHEFSGGQRQRIGIARALALEPKILILDEPTSALDVSVQAQVLNLLLSLQKRLGLTYLFISHDLSVIRYMCDRVALIYLGRIVEVASVATIFQNSLHPYTRALLSAMPEPDPTHISEEIILRGELSTLGATGKGCRFEPRCFAEKMPLCTEEEPELRSLDGDHQVACHLFR
ncbi:MAG: ABC transporter ATP-binding protein [Anaerolineae bacterium]